MKIVLNKYYGGFSLSKEVYDYLGKKWDEYGFLYNEHSQRTNKKLIEAIEKIGEENSSGMLADLKIIEIPDNCDYMISSYDGYETVYYSESKIYEK